MFFFIKEVEEVDKEDQREKQLLITLDQKPLSKQLMQI